MTSFGQLLGYVVLVVFLVVDVAVVRRARRSMRRGGRLQP